MTGRTSQRARRRATRGKLPGRANVTQDLRRAFRAIEEWDVGGLMINDVPIYRIDSMPFGGWKDSGFGREGTRYAMEEMTDIKHLVINYG